VQADEAADIISESYKRDDIKAVADKMCALGTVDSDLGTETTLPKVNCHASPRKVLIIPYHSAHDGLTATLLLALEQIRFCEVTGCIPVVRGIVGSRDPV
jgi:hypothetical protein